MFFFIFREMFSGLRSGGILCANLLLMFHVSFIQTCFLSPFTMKIFVFLLTLLMFIVTSECCQKCCQSKS